MLRNVVFYAADAGDFVCYEFVPSYSTRSAFVLMHNGAAATLVDAFVDADVDLDAAFNLLHDLWLLHGGA